MTTADLVAEFGEEYRQLIEESLAWLDASEKAWGTTLLRREYIVDMVAREKKIRGKV